ncbi:DUF86 domain-containing protein [Nodosilinea sp. LEGE 06152]|uniref:HepT-like ribonuclease domain-containing protein n=1 Tax=Nodosilinea sp. LEGE 06152 TaxID=2777966 RepID=UPI0018809A91|nr:HepT-like ribonuclease domain-containing protein [Nodosilinea sp. LEGE 06152]MBE9158211.1 DUF86 domain-containing protein [Nodosilinea sp. LEGE 06152]MBE9160636.1 DUF86 domain-containing protein [Nodosilinea sp. LEGE 06152]
MTALNDDIRLRHMLDAANQAIAFMEGRSKLSLDADAMLLLAVVKAIEIVGEAAAKITKERQAEIPQIPWSQIISMQNRLTHAYFDIDTDVLWQTIVEDLPELIRELETQIDQ